MKFKIEHDGGGCYFVYAERYLFGLFPYWTLAGVETSHDRAEARCHNIAEYPKYLEV